MNFEEFKEELTKEIGKELYERGVGDCELETKKMDKMNTSYEALTIKPEGASVGIRYLVGSAVMVKVGKDSRIKPLTDIDIKLMRTYFQMGLITLTYAGEKFGAYPLEYEAAA